MLSKKQQETLSEYIGRDYASVEEFVKQLDLGIEMLFYIEEDVFDIEDIQSVVFTMRLIIRAIRD